MIDEIHEMFVLPMNSYFMTHEPRAVGGDTEVEGGEAVALSSGASIPWSWSIHPFIASFACRLHDASCYHVFSLRAFVCTVCMNSQRNSRANKRTIANLETQNFLDVSFKSHRAQTIQSERYHQMIASRIVYIMVGDHSKYIFEIRVGSQ